MSIIIGIDLGTSKSCVSIVQDGKPIIIENSAGNRTTPSVVSFLNEGSVLVGDIAKGKAIINAEHTITNVKRLIGQKWSTVCEKDIHTIRNNSFKVEQGDKDQIIIKAQNKYYTPQQISSFILRKLKRAAEMHIGGPVSDAVITVPAYFNDAQRQATKEAGDIAGLNVLRIINEPTAAALAYGFNRIFPKDYRVAIFDLGGGTFDISILSICEGVFEVEMTAGNPYLGGNDFDFSIMHWLIEEFETNEKMVLGKHPIVLQRLKDAAEKAKIELSSYNEADIKIDYLISSGTNHKHINQKLTTKVFESLTHPTLEKIRIECEETLKKNLSKNGVSASDIHEVIMVGESCRIPKVGELVERVFGKKPRFGVNLAEAVAIGAAIQGAILNGEIRDILLLDVTPLNLGIEIGNLAECMIAANTTIPAKHSEVFTTTVDNQTTVEIRVVQGDRPLANQNTVIGTLLLDNIPPAPRGVPKIEVDFDIDANGIIIITATDKGSNVSKKICLKH